MSLERGRVVLVALDPTVGHDQVRSVDKRRVQKAFGRVAPEELEAIDAGLVLFLGLVDAA